MDCTEVEQSVDLYALGALQAAETRAIEAHVRDCSACTALLQSVRGVAQRLAYAVPSVEPSADLKTRILAVAHDTASGSKRVK